MNSQRVYLDQALCKAWEVLEQKDGVMYLQCIFTGEKAQYTEDYFTKLYQTRALTASNRIDAVEVIESWHSLKAKSKVGGIYA